MKIYRLLEILKGFNQDDEVLAPCAAGKLTDQFTVRPICIGSGGSRHVGLLPQEGTWPIGVSWEVALEGDGFTALTDAQRMQVALFKAERLKDPSVGARKVCRGCGKMDIPLNIDGLCNACIFKADSERRSWESAQHPITAAQKAEILDFVAEKKTCRVCRKQQGPLDDNGLCPWCIQQPYFCYKCNKEVKDGLDLSEDEGYCAECYAQLEREQGR